MNREPREQDCRWFAVIRGFMETVKRSTVLTPQQKNILCGQAKAGDLKGAQKGYEKIIRGDGYVERRKQR